MLAIILVAECYIAARPIDFGTIYSIEWRSAGRAIEKHAKESRVLCFGSSFTRMGVAPKVLEERLGVPAYSFAASGCQPYANYTALRHALAAGSKPEAIVVDFTWSVLALNYDWNERVLPEFASLPECAELAIAARDPGFLARLALVYALPSFRCRPEVRANVQAAVRGAEPQRYPQAWIMARNARVNRGGNHATGVGSAINLHDDSTFPLRWDCKPVSERYIHKFFELAESRGIPVFWLVPPISPGAQKHRDALGLDVRFTQFVERVVSRHRNVVVVDGRGSGYAPEAFVDMVHLNRDGAVAMSDDLADLMRDRLAHGGVDGPSWTRLPAYHPDPNPSRVEDMLTSATLIDQLTPRGVIR
jgi:hypothetical protein